MKQPDKTTQEIIDLESQLQHAYYVITRTLEYPIQDVMRRCELKKLQAVQEELHTVLVSRGYEPHGWNDPHWDLVTEVAASKPIWARFHDADFDSLWYAAGPGSYTEQVRYTSQWFAGVWTGPDHDLICVMRSSTKELAEEALSPGGRSPQEAVMLALAKRAQLLVKRGRCKGICKGVVTNDRQPIQCGFPAGHDGGCWFVVSRDAPWTEENKITEEYNKERE